MRHLPVLDTTFLIDLQREPRRTGPILERLVDEGDVLLVPLQVAVEYCAGCKEPARAFHDLGLAYTLVAFDEEHARRAAELAQRALLAGTLPGWADVQVAAVALLHGTYVVTRNARHFRDGLGVRVWDYRAEGEPPR